MSTENEIYEMQPLRKLKGVKEVKNGKCFFW